MSGGADVLGRTPAQRTPWKPVRVGDDRGRDVYDVVDSGNYALCGSFFKDEAHLVAAAPELLAAAQKALRECSDLIGTEAGDALEAAIRAAGGSL